MASPETEDAKETAKEEAPNKKQGPIICPGHSRPVPDLCYSSVTEHGVFLLSACLDGKPMLRDGVTGDWLGTFEGHKGAVWCARFNSDATRVVTASAEFNCKIWDAINGEETCTFKHGHIVKSVTFSHDDKQFYSGGHEKKIRIFDIERPDAEPQEILGHSKNITKILQSPNNEHLLISAAEEQNICVWDKRTLSIAHQCATEGPVPWIETEGDILTSTSNRIVQFWDLDKFTIIKQFDLPKESKHPDILNCASLDPARKFFVTGSNDELWVFVWDYETGQEVDCRKGHHGPVRCLAFEPTGSSYASGSEDGSIRIWNQNHSNF